MDDPFVLGLVLAVAIGALALALVLRGRPSRAQERARAEGLRLRLLGELHGAGLAWPAYEVATTPARSVAQVVGLARPCRLFLSAQLRADPGLDDVPNESRGIL